MNGLYCGPDGDDPVMALRHLHSWAAASVREFGTQIETSPIEALYVKGVISTWETVRDEVAATLDTLTPEWRRPSVVPEPPF